MSMVAYEDLNQPVYERLKSVARARGRIIYGDIAESLGFGRIGRGIYTKKVAPILDTINRYEHQQGRPMLTVLVVRSDTKRPGDGFFILAREFGLLSDTSEQAERQFLKSETARVYATWSEGKHSS